MTNHIRLYAVELEYKFGFNDGDILLNYEELGDADHHDMLVDLIEEYLLPKLSRKYNLQLWNTCHNPLRLHESEELDDIDANVYVDILHEDVKEFIRGRR